MKHRSRDVDQAFGIHRDHAEEIDQRAIAVAKNVATVFRVHKHSSASYKWLNQTIGLRQVLQQLRHNASFTARPFDW